MSSDSKTKDLSNQPKIGTAILLGVPIVSLIMEDTERLCLAQISNTLLKDYSYNEIHNRRVALGITCLQCSPIQLEMLRRAGAMPVSSRRCGMITLREAERLCRSFLFEATPPALPENFTFRLQHKCSWGCTGAFYPSRYNSSRAKCIRCDVCGQFISPNKFIFHSHRTAGETTYNPPDAANFNAWRRHVFLCKEQASNEHIAHAWEDVKAMFNGGTRKRVRASSPMSSTPEKKATEMLAAKTDSSVVSNQLMYPNMCFPGLPAINSNLKMMSASQQRLMSPFAMMAYNQDFMRSTQMKLSFPSIDISNRDKFKQWYIDNQVENKDKLVNNFSIRSITGEANASTAESLQKRSNDQKDDKQIIDTQMNLNNYQNKINSQMMQWASSNGMFNEICKNSLINHSYSSLPFINPVVQFFGREKEMKNNERNDLSSD